MAWYPERQPITTPVDWSRFFDAKFVLAPREDVFASYECVTRPLPGDRWAHSTLRKEGIMDVLVPLPHNPHPADDRFHCPGAFVHRLFLAADPADGVARDPCASAAPHRAAGESAGDYGNGCHPG